MVSVYQLKSRFQMLLRPISDSFARCGLTANTVTIIACILSCLVGVLIYFLAPQNALWYWILPLALFVRMALNAIDGMMAREHNQKTALGAILNELGDIVSDCVIYVPFLHVLHGDFWLILLFTVLTIISETVGIMGIQIGATRRYDGPMGKSDRAFWLGVLAAVAAHFTISPKNIDVIIGAFCFLLFYTVINRIYGALKEVRSQ